MYGFLPLNRNPSPRERDQVSALFGFAEVMVPEHGKIERQVTVEFHHIRSGLGPRLTQQGLDLKRAGLWNHVQRNQRVAVVANEVVAQHGEAEDVVVVLVEGVEHALSLSSVLPGWPIVTAEYVNNAGLTTQQQSLLRAGRNPFRDYTKPIIATASAVVNMDLSAIAAIVRADGGKGLPPIARRQLIADPSLAALELHDFDVGRVIDGDSTVAGDAIVLFGDLAVPSMMLSLHGTKKSEAKVRLVNLMGRLSNHFSDSDRVSMMFDLVIWSRFSDLALQHAIADAIRKLRR